MKPVLTCLAVSATLALTGLIQAQTYTFVTPSGSTDTASDKVSAEALFTVGNGTLTIDLSNLLTAAEVKNVGQNLSDISFTLSQTPTAFSVESSTSTFIDVNGNGAGSVTISHDQDGYMDKMGWGLHSLGSGGFHLDGLAGLYTPAMTLIGGTEGVLTPYANANSSICHGTGPHNPFAQGEADFTLNMAGITAGTEITSATFSFGTAGGDDVNGRFVPPSPTPEPFTLAFAGFGALLGMSKVRRTARAR